MNDRIQSLYTQVCGKEWRYDFDPTLAEEFALLIIEKCADACFLNIVGMVGTHANAYNSAIAACAKQIKQTFGVEQ
jgi:hypothetical protein